MSALWQKRTSENVRIISALPPKADMGTQSRNVRFVPKADIGRLIQSTRRGDQKRWGEYQAERLRRFEVDDRRTH